MKKYHLHLDAVIVITLVVVASLGMNYFQYSIYKDLSAENIQLTKDNVIGDMNLTSCRSALDRSAGQDQQAATN
ncbi:MAG: hypothetical protein PVF23_02990 [Chromatiales bacterium]|jgi:hypothetical protein